jgi:hypothetical protein
MCPIWILRRYRDAGKRQWAGYWSTQEWRRHRNREYVKPILGKSLISLEFVRFMGDFPYKGTF